MHFTPSGIAGVVALLLLIVIIFVIIVRWRRRKRRREMHQFENNRESNDMIYNFDDIKRNNKMNNIEATNVVHVSWFPIFLPIIF